MEKHRLEFRNESTASNENAHGRALPWHRFYCGYLRRTPGVSVTPAASISFFMPEFDTFLYAPIALGRDEMPLSVLSALARLNVDPWQEAAELAELPKTTAAQRLALLIAQLPGDRWTQADIRTIADRLIELLPRRGNFTAPLAEKGFGFHEISKSAGAKILMCVGLAAAVFIIAASYERSSRSGLVDAPGFSTDPQPQTSRPSSR